MDPADIETRWQDEKKAIKTTYDRTISLAKDGKVRVHYKVFDDCRAKLTRAYVTLIQAHLERNKAEFEAYFQSSTSPIIAFDVEEINNEIICILGIHVGPGMQVEVYLDSLDKAPSADETAKQMKRLKKWLASKKHDPVLLTHGFNQKEHALMADSGHEFVNTQKLLDEILAKSDNMPQKPSIYTFEQMTGFKRSGCSFLKHAKEMELPKKDLAFLFPKQARLSIWNLSDEKKPLACCLCDKTQDVFLYCVEDAFITILIFLYYRNHVAPCNEQQ